MFLRLNTCYCLPQCLKVLEFQSWVACMAKGEKTILDSYCKLEICVMLTLRKKFDLICFQIWWLFLNFLEKHLNKQMKWMLCASLYNCQSSDFKLMLLPGVTLFSFRSFNVFQKSTVWNGQSWPVELERGPAVHPAVGTAVHVCIAAHQEPWSTHDRMTGKAVHASIIASGFSSTWFFHDYLLLATFIVYTKNNKRV